MSQSMRDGFVRDDVTGALAVTGVGFSLAGKLSIPTAESTSATTYAVNNLATQDVIPAVVLPTNGLIVVGYQAIWQNTVTVNGRAAIFIGANQLKGGTGTGAPTVIERNGPVDVSDDALLFTIPNGLGMQDGAGAATEVTTGQVIGMNPNLSSNFGGVCYIFAAAGTYDVSVQFKNNAAGTTTVKNRHLWVATLG